MSFFGRLDCNICRTRIRRHEARAVEHGQMLALAKSGFGDVVPILSAVSPDERRATFERFVTAYPMKWRMCAACTRLAAPYSLGSDAEGAPPSIASTSAIHPSLRQFIEALLGNRFARITGRIAIGFLGVWFLLLAISVITGIPAYMPDLTRRAASIIYVPTGLAGISRATAIWSAAASLLLLNAAFVGRSGHGPIDYVFVWLSRRGFPVIGFDTTSSAVLVGLAIGIWLAIEIGFRTVVHWSPETAAQAFLALPDRLSVATTMDLAFLLDGDGRRHVAALTPDFIRAFEEQLPLGSLVSRPEYQTPGFLPILGLFLFGALQIWRVWPLTAPGTDLVRDREVDRISAQTLFGFGLVTLYVTEWTGAVQSGIFTGDRAANVVQWNLVGLAWLLAISGAIVLATLWRRLVSGGGSILTRWAWSNLIFASALVAVTLPYLYSTASAGSPGKIWLLAYWLAATLCWLSTSPRTLSIDDAKEDTP